MVFDLDRILIENQTLRDERDRLRSALVKCRRELWHCNEQLKYKGATEGFSVTEALSEAKAALTPAGQQWTRSKPTAPGWYWWRDSASKPAAMMHLERDIDTDCLMAIDLLGAPHVRFSSSLMDGEWQGPLTPNEATE